MSAVEDIVDRHMEDLGARLQSGVVIPEEAGKAIRGTIAAAVEEALRGQIQKTELQYAAHEATYGDSKAVQQVDEFLQKKRKDPNRLTDDYGRGFFAGIKATMEHLKRQPR